MKTEEERDTSPPFHLGFFFPFHSLYIQYPTLCFSSRYLWLSFPSSPLSRVPAIFPSDTEQRALTFAHLCTRSLTHPGCLYEMIYAPVFSYFQTNCSLFLCSLCHFFFLTSLFFPSPFCHPPVNIVSSSPHLRLYLQILQIFNVCFCHQCGCPPVDAQVRLTLNFALWTEDCVYACTLGPLIDRWDWLQTVTQNKKSR